MHRSGIYARVARCWAGVFAVVGLAFLVAPGTVAATIEAVARAAHLQGSVETGGGRLWWVLAVSLMAVLTRLALASAQRPEDRTAYNALLTSKVVSTLGFAALAIQSGSAWWICAGADGFVAVTLVLADRADRPCAQGSVTVA